MEQFNTFAQSATLIHYVFQTGPERIACTPNQTEFYSTPHHPPILRSNSTSAVTCPACRRTEAYKQAKANHG